MATPITIYRNNENILEATDIQKAAEFLSKHLQQNKNASFNAIERGYVYDIPYYHKEEEYRFVAPERIAFKRRKQLEEREHVNARRYWLVPSNPNEYDLAGAFSYYDKIHWRRSANYENGDIVFIYLSNNVQKVCYKVEVIKGLVPPHEVEINKTFWKDEEKFKQSKTWTWSCFRLIDQVDTNELLLAHLRENGVKGNIQGPQKVTGELRDYILSFFKHDLTKDYYPDEVPESLGEGKRKSVTVNVFERNPIARKLCIEHYGLQCQVCNLNFEVIYGGVGKDFIHVHHIVPLHEIQQDYEVNPILDLIPVCPNCHAMLHRKENGMYLSVEQLKKRILKRY
ncbi:HNH endonuclease [Bacillus sp. UMB0728]|uniref:HNH endonuclease n=1 Tax=Bacillus sp. UMB0728 TaxID=2066052 RepID=UPI000C77F26F|nr:HNH endonuclease [Bacillus sp. UMB0728]PLR71026.1 HNH endonuclease [Bacillus sp. UMB0728]